MENAPHIGFLKVLQSHTPDPHKPLALIRKEFSEFSIACQQDNEPEPLVERVTIDENNLTGYFVSVEESAYGLTVLFFHGGRFTVGSTADHLWLITRIARASGTRVLSVDYWLAPEHTFPSAVNNAINSYRWLIARGHSSHRINPMGISAGGNLVLSLLLSARDLKLPLPAAAVCISPAMDLDFPGASVQKNREKDWITPERLAAIRTSYLAGHNSVDPLASPIHANLRNLPRVLVQAGMREALYDDITSFIDKAR
ncbi:MAG: acetyl esterase [Methanoregula sp. PtaU1.Bin051]|nr:MAG: acetyl esterase [Methanoregula sp. PtaU1.Bin051]